MALKNHIVKFRYEIFICLFLITATSCVYMQITNHEFINYDDDWLVSNNIHIQKGITLEGIIWAFKSGSGYWKPLTFLSLMLDCQLFGMNAGAFLMTNLLFHILNAILLFLVLRRMTSGLWQSAFVATLFALHPLHVESVAWVTERKDVLSAFFWLLTMWSYTWYSERPGYKRYIPVLFFFCMGLMAKPMLVTLPFVLLLLDHWPLGRLLPHDLKYSSPDRFPYSLFKNGFRLIREKIPLFVLAAFSVCMTLTVFRGDDAVSSAAMPLSLSYRISNAIVSYVSYIGKMIWPTHLAIPYPFYTISIYKITGAFALLVTITIFALKFFRSRPYFAVGWLWYIGTLVPVIGVRYFGPFAMADRFTYIPLIGLFIIAAWGIPDLFIKFRYKKVGYAMSCIVLVLFLAHRTWIQAGYWKNNITLFKHAVKVTKKNIFAHNNLGQELALQGKTSEAIEHYLESLRIRPDYDKAHNNLGNALEKLGRTDEALIHYSEALRINPDYAEAHNNIGNIFLKQGQIDKAIKHYKQALKINPNYGPAHFNMGIALAKTGRLEDAIGHYTEAKRLNPNDTQMQRNLDIVLSLQKQINSSIKKIKYAIKLNPENPELIHQLGNLLQKKGETDEAIKLYERTLSLNPEFIPALSDLAYIYAGKKDYDRSISFFSQIIKLEPWRYKIYYNIACLYSQKNEIAHSIGWLKKAIDKGYDNWGLIKTDKDLENVRSSVLFTEFINRYPINNQE